MAQTTNRVIGLKLPDGSIVDVGDKFKRCLVMIQQDYLRFARYFRHCHRNYFNSQTPGNQFVFFWQTLTLLKKWQPLPILLVVDYSGGMEIMDNPSINMVEDVVATGCYPRDAGQFY
jgi:glycolate oxidase